MGKRMPQPVGTWMRLLAWAPLLVVGCDRGDKGGAAPKPAGEKAMSITLSSLAFEAGQAIPVKYTGEGADVSPPLRWSNLPEGTKELALICDDPDAPTPQPWVHWVIYKIPPEAGGLAEGIPRTERLADPPGALQGRNSWARDNLGYRGPMPPPGHGRHRYYFRLYALGAQPRLRSGLSKEELLEAIRPHILGEGVLMGTYERK